MTDFFTHDHEHEWEQEVSYSRFGGNPHRKCKVPGCLVITLDLNDEDDDYEDEPLSEEEEDIFDEHELPIYEIVRFRFDGDNEVIREGVTLEQAQEHCNDPSTSGDGWFDGYREM